MNLKEHHIQALTGSQEQFEIFVREQRRQSVHIALMNVLEEEVEAVIGAERYERTEQRRDHRNGHYTRTLETTIGQITDLPVPRTRHGHQTQVFERYHRRREDTDQAIGAMFGSGVSTKGVGNVMETLTGTDPSPSTVSRVFHSLLAFYSFPKEHWKTIHTNNIIKCFFEEVKRRFHKIASAFRNEDSLCCSFMLRLGV